MSQPLTGIRVVDLTSALSGPFCTMLLGDLGAEVIKVEPMEGDMLRKAGPFIKGEGAYFIFTNRNKKSLALNLKDNCGREILFKLIQKADVLVENFRPEVKKRLEIEYSFLKKANPGLVYCSISGFGQTGPWANRPSFDQIAQGMSGLMSVTGFPEGPPTRVGVAIGDSVAGLFAAYGILAALFERQRSGQGQFVSTSLLEGLIAHLGFQAAKYFASGETPSPQGNDHATMAPYGTFRTKDGYINIAAGTEKMWVSLYKALDEPELGRDPRFDSIYNRVKNKVTLRAKLEKIIEEKSTAQWLEILKKAEVACGPIYTLDQVFGDEQVLNQQMLLEVEHAQAGLIKMIGFPVKLERTNCQIKSPPPCWAQHTDEILGELNYSFNEIEGLEKEGVVGRPNR